MLPKKLRMNYLVNNCTEPYFNMALDEWCLENLSLEGTVFYLWRNRPSVIIGLNQNAYSEVNIPYLEANGILLARRVTGGGAVYHDLQNLNYTIIRKLCGSDNGRDAVGLIAAALQRMGVPAEVSGRNDITVAGRKVSGFARRVWKDREIIHGTLMYDVDIDTLTEALNVSGSKLESKGIASVRSRVANLKSFPGMPSSIEEFMSALHLMLVEGGSEIRISEENIQEVQRTATAKFATWDWIFGRSDKADIVFERRLACGTVGVYVKLDGGIIREMNFRGDFMGALPANRFAEKLVGLRYDRRILTDAVSEIDPALYFDNASVRDIVDLISGGYHEPVLK